MPAKKGATRRKIMSDMARVDAHVIQPEGVLKSFLS